MKIKSNFSLKKVDLGFLLTETGGGFRIMQNWIERYVVLVDGLMFLYMDLDEENDEPLHMKGVMVLALNMNYECVEYVL